MTLLRWLTRLAGLVALVLFNGAVAAPAFEYSVLIRGETAGAMTIDAAADGRVQVIYGFKDNGRGPDLRETWRADAFAQPVAYRVEGRSTFGAEIRESFEFDAGRLRWASRVDHGDQIATFGEMFVPLEASPAYFGQLATSLLMRGVREAPVAGGHKVTLERIASVTLPSPQGPVALSLVVLNGIDTDPWHLWLRNDGSHRLFASVDPRLRVIEKGFESLAQGLLDQQLAHQDQHLRQLQERFAHALPGVTLISQVRWFDSVNSRMEGPSDIWLLDGRISSITSPGRARIDPDHVIDGRGQTILPGLIDMHVHYSADQGLSRIAAGVTSVREMGNQNRDLRRLKARIDRGELLGPSVFPAGFIEGRSRFASRNGFVVDNLDEARTAVDWYAARGYRQIKLYNSIRPEWLEPLTAHAKRRGLKVSGHVPAFMRAEDAVKAGFDELVHINQVMLNFVAKPSDDTRTLLRFSRVGEDAHAVDTGSKPVQDFVRLLRDKGTVVDPTLVAFESMFTQRQGEPNPTFAAVADHLPALMKREIRLAEMDLEGPRLQTYRQSFQRMLEMTRALYQAGVPLIAGTDSPSGLALLRELELYVDAGIPPAKALQAATWNAAKALGESERLGSIERGKVADLVLIDGDPARRISDLRRATLVIKGGVAYQPARLYRAMGYKPFVDAVPIDGVQADD